MNYHRQHREHVFGLASLAKAVTSPSSHFSLCDCIVNILLFSCFCTFKSSLVGFIFGFDVMFLVVHVLVEQYYSQS
jgi:hypothetical protein